MRENTLKKKKRIKKTFVPKLYHVAQRPLHSLNNDPDHISWSSVQRT